ncbi:MAG: hypothetical protein V3R64_02715 [Sphingomonadales bacterium]
MIKKTLKVLTLVFIIVGFYSAFTYFNGLDFKRESPLVACWSIQLTDPETGEAIVGVEDIFVDYQTGEVFLSAYDRRLVRRQEGAGKVNHQGGIYVFPAKALEGQPKNLSVRKISTFDEDVSFLPHGMGYSRRINRNKMVAINRVYDSALNPRFEVFQWNGVVLSGPGNLQSDLVCNPNDLAVYWFGFFVTNDHAECGVERYNIGETFGPTGAVYHYTNGEFKLFAEGLLTPNGVAVLKGERGDLLAVSLTRDETIRLYKISTGELVREIEVPGAPDNLTIDQNGDIYFTIFPNLLDYYFYISEKMTVKKSPTGVFRISAKSKWHTIDMLFHDDGDIISGATVAQRVGDFLIMGSGWDDNIAICSGMNEFKNDQL